ncbi:MAG: DEAD/DEAH box helicase [Rhodospirillales bacterium]|nr:DEAD/DEAH box helicase [Rhodospirillales bacterium]
MSFDTLGLGPDVVRAVSDAGYTTPTPIQAQAIPVVLTGRDVLGCAQTGTGKTAGFTLPMIEILGKGRAKARMPRSLILEPTRELAAQVSESFEKYGKYHKLSKALLIGGVSFGDQEKALDRGVDVLIATPGRLMDHFGRGGILLNDVKILVIDEADRMLDMGFIPDVEKIVGLLPRIRQTLFFSATMAPEIRRLADAFLSNPKEISVAPPASTAATVAQHLVVVTSDMKREALRRLIHSEQVKNALIFCNRKRDVDILVKSLSRHGFNVGGLHGDMAQSFRMETLDRFKAGEITFLVCSDVAARGLDISDLSHVFNFDVPIHAEDYVHRIGRTGRAGREGKAFTLAAPADGRFVAQIEKLIGKPIPVITIEGLDTPAYEEGDGRRGRGGRGRAASGRAEGGRGEGGRGRGERRPRREQHAEPVAAAVEAAPAIPAAPDTMQGEQPQVDAWPQADDTAIRDERPMRQDRGPRHGRRNEPRGERHDRDIDRSRRRREGGPGEQADNIEQLEPRHRGDHRGGGDRPAAERHRPERHQERRPERSHERQGRERHRHHDDGPPVVGFGDDLPAFLTRKVG